MGFRVGKANFGSSVGVVPSFAGNARPDGFEGVESGETTSDSFPKRLIWDGCPNRFDLRPNPLSGAADS